MKYMTFQDRFHELVRDGRKTQTIRPVRKRNPIIAGERISLRGWRGKPYRSKQFELVQGDVFQTSPIEVGYSFPFKDHYIQLGDVTLSPMQQKLLTLRDGFESEGAFFGWFVANHGIPPFHGTLIRWTLHFPIREAICAHALEESIANNPFRNLI